MPLRAFLPSTSSSISPDLLPTYPPILSHDTPTVALDASLQPTIVIPTERNSHESAHATSLASVERPSDELETEMRGRKPAIAAAGTFLGLVGYSQLYQNFLFSKLTPPSERAEEQTWLASSHSWLERKVCGWFGLCGLTHLDKSKWTGWDGKKESIKAAKLGDIDQDSVDLTEFWRTAGRARPEDWSEDERNAREVPHYVLEHAPPFRLRQLLRPTSPLRRHQESAIRNLRRPPSRPFPAAAWPGGAGRPIQPQDSHLITTSVFWLQRRGSLADRSPSL